MDAKNYIKTQNISNAQAERKPSKGCIKKAFFNLTLVLTSCISLAAITPTVETSSSSAHIDGADDPAIWYNNTSPENSVIFGTDKKGGGIGVYNLQGRELSFFKSGKINNVDVRYNIVHDNNIINIVAATNRTDDSILVATYDNKSQKLVSLVDPISPIYVGHKVYGFCLYKDLKQKKLYGFVTTKSGLVTQWELKSKSGYIYGNKVRELTLSSKTEGCVADDEYARVFIGEEDVGIWRFGANPNDTTKGKLIASIADNPNLASDIEGLAIYHTGINNLGVLSDSKGYLLASVQSVNQYAIFERTGEHKYIASFSISNNSQIDGVSKTDGIALISSYLGPLFPYGMLVVHDDENLDPMGLRWKQNYKLIRWDNIALNLPDKKLIIDETWQPA